MKIQCQISNPSLKTAGPMYLKMKRAVKKKAKRLHMPLSKYLGITHEGTGKKEKLVMPFLYDFTKLYLGASVNGGYKIQFPTGINVFALVYLVRKNMIGYSEKHGWTIVAYAKDSEKPANYKYLTWNNFVKDNFPRVTDEELSMMYRGTVADSVKYRMIKQYTGGKGWCQTGVYPDSNISFVQCYDKDKKVVFWEDLHVLIKIANIIKLKKKIVSYTKKLKMPKQFRVKAAKDMSDAELYQYLYSRKKEYIKKLPREPAGGWKLLFLTRDMFMEGKKRGMIKKYPKFGWALIE